jgi:hypothetical protein|tara:strand:+ start:65 stop:682 length:618 start_codon:yes stop_codon:yes gene_type:complete
MKKLLLIIFFSFFGSNISIADTRYNLIQINCYEESGYFELRKLHSWNLNMYGVSEDENLISLFGENKEYESITRECVFPKKKFVENQVTIMIAIHPFCRTPFKGIAYEGSEKRCNEIDAEFDIWHIDEKGKRHVIDKGKFWFGDEPNTKRISKIEYKPKDLYFVIHFEETIDPNLIEKQVITKEESLFMSNYKYPLTADNLSKMF